MKKLLFILLFLIPYTGFCQGLIGDNTQTIKKASPDCKIEYRGDSVLIVSCSNYHAQYLIKNDICYEAIIVPNNNVSKEWFINLMTTTETYQQVEENLWYNTLFDEEISLVYCQDNKEYAFVCKSIVK